MKIIIPYEKRLPTVSKFSSSIPVCLHFRRTLDGASYHVRSAINKGDQTVVSLSDHPKAPQADAKDFFDNRSLKEFEDSGFVKKLYSRRERHPRPDPAGKEALAELGETELNVR